LSLHEQCHQLFGGGVHLLYLLAYAFQYRYNLSTPAAQLQCSWLAAWLICAYSATIV
jgi:hypothetical protein